MLLLGEGGREGGRKGGREGGKERDGEEGGREGKEGREGVSELLGEWVTVYGCMIVCQ